MDKTGKIHGHMTVELTNVKTGEKEIHEDDNRVTNLFQHLVGDYGWDSVHNWQRYRWDYDQNKMLRGLSEGLMMFDNTLAGGSEGEEDLDIVYPSAGATLVACAAHTVQDGGTNLQAGSFSQKESRVIKDEASGEVIGYKYVWNFATEQGNGEIKSACLAPQRDAVVTIGCPTRDHRSEVGHGYVYGYDTPYAEVTRLNSDRLMNRLCLWDEEGKYGDFWNEEGCGYFLYLDIYSDRIIRTAKHSQMANFGKTGLLELDIIYQPYNTMNMFYNAIPSNHLCNKIGRIKLDFKTMANNFPSAYSSYVSEIDTLNRCGFSTEFGKMHFYTYTANQDGDGCAPGAKIYIWTIDVNDFHCINFRTITNTSGETLKDTYMTTFRQIIHENLPMKYYKGNLYAITKDNHYVKINEETGSADFFLDGNSGNLFTCSSNTLSPFIELYNSGRFWFYPFNFCVDDGVSFYSTSIPEEYVTYDSKTNKVFYVNCRNQGLFNYGDYWGKWIKPIHGTTRVLGFANGWDGNQECRGVYGGAMIPGAILTVNNLDTPITKTNEQTMKVTYEIYMDEKLDPTRLFGELTEDKVHIDIDNNKTIDMPDGVSYEVRTFSREEYAMP